MPRKTNPHVVRFLRDNCILKKDAEALAKTLWQKYCEWTHIKRMHHTHSLHSFNNNCKKAGLEPVSDRKCVIKWKGVMLKHVPFADDNFVGLSIDITVIPPVYCEGEHI
jgi:hypothetical protein